MQDALWWAVDLLASEYGGGLKPILETVYLDDLPDLIIQINKRKLMDYKMQLAIVSNPHTKNPGKLWQLLTKLDTGNRQAKKDDFDNLGFERLKGQLSKRPTILVK